MNSMSGVNLSPLAHLLLMGLAVAFGPLLWVWLRQRHLGGAGLLRALTLITLFLTFDLVLFGAFTRLTDSGLGCPDWPGCYGHASPVGASTAIAAASAVTTAHTPPTAESVVEPHSGLARYDASMRGRTNSDIKRLTPTTMTKGRKARPIGGALALWSPCAISAGSKEPDVVARRVLDAVVGAVGEVRR